MELTQDILVSLLKEGKSTTEIAKIYGISRKTVNNKVTFARKNGADIPMKNKGMSGLTRIESKIYRFNASGRYAVRLKNKQLSFDTLKEAQAYKIKVTNDVIIKPKKKYKKNEQQPELSMSELTSDNSGYVVIISKDKDILKDLLSQVRL